jgi:hypothetical protein
VARLAAAAQLSEDGVVDARLPADEALEIERVG